MDIINVYSQLIFLSLVNIISTIAGVALNTLVIAILAESSHLRAKICYFMIMVLSCLDLLAVVTNHPLLAVQLVLWLYEKEDELTPIKIYVHSAHIFPCLSFFALLVMNIERYLGAFHPVFHRSSVTKRKLLAFLATLLILPTILITISANDRVISFPLAITITFGIIIPPFIYINYKLFRISRKMRRKVSSPANDNSRTVDLRSISTCLLAIAFTTLLTSPTILYVAFSLDEKSTSNTVRLSYLWARTLHTMNSSFNNLIFFWRNNVLRTEGRKVLKELQEVFRS